VSGLPGTAWELLRRLFFFYDNLEVFVAHKVIGRDLAIGFRGVGMNEARPILEPAIRRGRGIRKMGSPSSSRILSTSSVRDLSRRYTASSGCTGFPPTTQSGTWRTWATRTELFGGARTDRFIEIFGVPSWETTYVSMKVG
jgi:hypothetical protein